MIRNLVIILLFCCNIVYSQQYTKSPWSAKGLGEEDYTGNATFSGIGNTRGVYIDSTVLNFYNPASYAFLSHGQPIFSTGAYIQNYQFTQNGLTSKNNTLSLSNIAFGLSFADCFGFAFGVRPFSNTGYDIAKSSWNGLDTVTSQLNGSGNLAYAFGGFSFKIFNLPKHKFALGVNLGNVFGTNLNRQTIYIKNEIIGSIKQSTLKINGFTPEFGLNYQWIFNKSSNLSIAATYKSKVQYTAENKVALISASDFTNEKSFDTLDYTTVNGKITYPSSFELGFKYDFTKFENRSSLKVPQFIFLASYKFANWKEYAAFSNETFQNALSYNVGVQFAPHVDFYDRSKAISFFSRVRYRVGYQYAMLPWSYNGNQLFSQSFSAGFGLPITSQRTLSSLNFAVNYGNRTNGVDTSFSEKTLGFSLGITISPAFYDRWFRKNKID